MKILLISFAAIALLCGCPDARVPKKPPSVPEPKLSEPASKQSVSPAVRHLQHPDIT
jgi:hypothetical protein